LPPRGKGRGASEDRAASSTFEIVRTCRVALLTPSLPLPLPPPSPLSLPLSLFLGENAARLNGYAACALMTVRDETRAASNCVNPIRHFKRARLISQAIYADDSAGWCRARISTGTEDARENSICTSTAAGVPFPSFAWLSDDRCER